MWWGGEERSGVKPEIKLCRLSRNRVGGFWGTLSFEILQMHLLNPAEGSKSVVSQKCHMVKCV